MFCLLNSKRRAEQKIQVHFNVVLPLEEFKFKRGEDKVHIRFAIDPLGGWTSMNHTLEIEK